MMKPNFFCIGAQKAGTTTLHDILKEHDQIFLPSNKEAHFFDDEDRYKKGFEWYLNTFFSESVDEQAVGSFTPKYLYYPRVAERIYKDLGSDIKFIVILRNPVDRAISHYQMSRFRGFETENFLEAIKQEDIRLNKGAWERDHFSYIDRGYYSRQLEEYLKYYPIDNFLFIVFEKEIKKNIDDTIVKIQKFLDIDVKELDCSLKSNEAKSTKSFYLNHLLSRKSSLKSIFKFFMPAKYRERINSYLLEINKSHKVKVLNVSEKEKKEILNTYFARDIEELEKLTGLNLRIWKSNV